MGNGHSATQTQQRLRNPFSSMANSELVLGARELCSWVKRGGLTELGHAVREGLQKEASLDRVLGSEFVPAMRELLPLFIPFNGDGTIYGICREAWNERTDLKTRSAIVSAGALVYSAKYGPLLCGSIYLLINYLR